MKISEMMHNHENHLQNQTDRAGKSQNKNTNRSKDKSLGKNMMKKKDEKKVILPTCSYKIKLN